jgi:hypothetical protein
LVHTCNPSYSGGRDRRIEVQSHSRQIVHETLSQKHPSQKINGGGELVEWLKVKTLSSSPSTAKKKKKKAGLMVQACHPSYREKYKTGF